MLKLKIELLGTGATRVVIVPQECTLESLHEVIQALFGWDGSHLWSFRAKNDMRWEPAADSPFDIFGSAPEDPGETCVGSVLAKKGASLVYTYDFGDDWRHRITRMTDPKSGSEYGCVKTVGPDGLEDCGGPMGLAEEDVHVPTLIEVNGRLPKKLKTGDFIPPVSAKSPDDVTLRDAVASKDMEVLSQVATPDEPRPSREECIERSLELITKHPETLKLFLLGLEDRHYRVMTEALTKGVGVLEFPSPNEIGIFEGYPYVYVEQKRRGIYKVVAPREQREVWQKNCMAWGISHERWNEIQRYASAAVRLYGVIGIHDFVELLKQYDVPGPFSEEIVEHLLDVRSYSGFASHAVVNGELRWVDFDDDEEADSGLYASFLDDEEADCGLYASFLHERIEVPRCTTLSKDAFLAYSDESYVEDCEPVRALLAFIVKKVGRLDSPELVMRIIVEHLVCGYKPGQIVAGLSNSTLPGKDKYSEKLRKMIDDVQANIRLPIYNGHTYREVREMMDCK